MLFPDKLAKKGLTYIANVAIILHVAAREAGARSLKTIQSESRETMKSSQEQSEFYELNAVEVGRKQRSERVLWRA